MLDVAQKRQKKRRKKKNPLLVRIFSSSFEPSALAPWHIEGVTFLFSSSDGDSSWGCTVRSPSVVSREECEIFPCPGATETQ